jgi:hypothetical protein
MDVRQKRVGWARLALGELGFGSRARARDGCAQEKGGLG